MMIFYLFIHLFLLFGVSLNKVKSKFEGRRVSMRRENAFHLSLRVQFSLYIRTIYRIVIIFQFFFSFSMFFASFKPSLPLLSSWNDPWNSLSARFNSCSIRELYLLRVSIQCDLLLWCKVTILLPSFCPNKLFFPVNGSIDEKKKKRIFLRT